MAETLRQKDRAEMIVFSVMDVLNFFFGAADLNGRWLFCFKKEKENENGTTT